MHPPRSCPDPLLQLYEICGNWAGQVWLQNGDEREYIHTWDASDCPLQPVYRDADARRIWGKVTECMRRSDWATAGSEKRQIDSLEGAKEPKYYAFDEKKHMWVRNGEPLPNASPPMGDT